MAAVTPDKYASASSITIPINDSYDIGAYSITVENTDGVSSPSAFSVVQAEPYPTPDFDLSPIYTSTSSINVMTASGVEGEYVLRIWNSIRNDDSIPMEQRYTDTIIVFTSGGSFDPDEDNLDVTPVEYKLTTDPITGQQYFTIIPKETKPGSYNLRIHNAEGVGSSPLTVLDSIGKPEIGGYIVEVLSFAKNQEPEIINDQSPAIDPTYGYNDFIVNIPLTSATEPGSYMLSITNLDGRGQ